VEGTVWPVPGRVECDGDRLVYDTRDGFERWVDSGPGLLENFLALGDASDDDIVRFAQRWGVLHLCEHELPASHNPGVFPVWTVDDSPGWPSRCQWLGEAGSGHIRPIGVYWESIATWRKFARQGMAVVRVIAGVESGSLITPEDRALVSPRSAHFHRAGPYFGGQSLPAGIEGNPAGIATASTRTLVADAGIIAEGWVRLGGVRLNCEVTNRIYDDGHGDFELAASLGGRSLFAALAVQLLTVVTRSDGFAICSACGSLYGRQIKPKRGQRNYCPPCQVAKKPQRDAEAQRRRRQAIQN